MLFWFYDYWYIVLVVPAMLLAMIASISVNATFKKYERQTSARRISGAEAARRVLDANGLYSVQIRRTPGNLTDHYNPRDNTIYLSDAVHDNVSTAAIGVAAHEAGHAVQHAVGYFPIKVRSAIIPLCQIGSNLAWPLILIGLLLQVADLAMLGVILFSTATVFQLVTLPCEFNASSRAMSALRSFGRLSDEDLSSARKTLTAAALTYVAALAVSVLNLLRMISLVNRRR